MKKFLALSLFLSLALTPTACGAKPAAPSASSPESAPAPVELYVSAAASLTESLDTIIALYREAAPHVTVVPTYDSSGTLLTQIENGAACDLFLSAAQKQMDDLDPASGKDNDGLVNIDPDTRTNLLENKVVLAVPEGNPKGIDSFDALAEQLKTGGILLAMGNADVPVGQYTQKIFAYYGLDEAALAAAALLTYGSNVKEVTTQVSEATVDCGIIYATDASAAGLAVVDEATAEMCGQVVYPAAVLKSSAQPDEAAAFLDFLRTKQAAVAFQAAGFTVLP